MEKKNKLGRGFGGEFYLDEEGKEHFIPYTQVDEDKECCGSVEFDPCVSGTRLFTPPAHERLKDSEMDSYLGLDVERALRYIESKEGRAVLRPIDRASFYGKVNLNTGMFYDEKMKDQAVIYTLSDETHEDYQENPVTYSEVFGGAVKSNSIRYTPAYDAQTGVFVGEYTDRVANGPEDELMDELTNPTHIPIQFKDGTRAVIISAGGGVGRDALSRILYVEEFVKHLESGELQIKIEDSILNEIRQSITTGMSIMPSIIDDSPGEICKEYIPFDKDVLKCPRWKNPSVIPNSKADRKFNNQWKRNKNGRKR